MKLALIGHGAIAHQLLSFAQTRSGLDIVLILDRIDSAEPGGPAVTTDFADILAARPDLVVECASHEAVNAYGVRCLEAGLDLLVISIGSLADETLYNALSAAAETGQARLMLPAGAVIGIDGLVAAKAGGLERVTLRSVKPPPAWAGAPGVAGVDLNAMTEPTTLFRGNARQAALAFPKNANIAATIALAGLGFEDTAVELVADPAVTTNCHRIDAAGAFGQFAIEIDNVPSPDNPKTSQMTALNILRLIEGQEKPVWVG